MIEQLIQRWGQLAARERKLLALALIVAIIAIIHLGLVEPAWQGRDAIEARLPLLRQQVAEADALVTEARALSPAASASARPSLPAVRLRLEQSLEAAGLRGALQQIQSSDTLIDLRLRDIGFSVWLNWLEPVLRETRLRVADLSITRESEPGRVTVRMVLELAGSERR
jgi:general secretion pathway protein M